MEIIGATEARANFAELLRRVSAEGERIAIERRGKPRAALVPLEDLEQAGARSEQALAESEQRFRDFAEASSDWFWEMDENCRFSYFSDRFTEVTGVAHEALLGKTRAETRIPGVEPEVWRRHLADLAARRSFRGFCHARTCPDGRVVQLSINGKAVFDEANNFKGYRGTGRDITERMQVEKSLRETNALFEETERLAKLGHWEWDEVEDRCTYCSEELARLHGITVDEFLEGASSLAADLEWVHPGDRRQYRGMVTRLWETGKGHEMEFRLRQPDGSYLDAREVAEAVFDQQGSVIRSFGFVQDITEQKKSEEALRQSEALLKQAMRTARMGAWVWDDATDQCVYCSEELALLFGQSVEEFLAARGKGADVTAAIHPDDRDHYRKSINDSVETGKWYSVEFRERVADGTYHHFREVGEPAYDERGGRLNSAGIVQDITESKDTEQALRLSEAALSHAQRQARIGSWRWDIPKNKLTSCSEEYARVHGVTMEQAPAHLGAQMERVIHPDDRARVEAEFNRFDEEGIDYEIEYRITRPDGEVRHVLEIGETLFDEDGRPVEQTGTVQDITERKRAEEDLERYRDELEQRVEERTAQLRDSENRYRTIFDTATAGIGRTLLEDGRVILSNEKLAQMFGYDAVDAFVSEFVFSEHYVDPNDRARLMSSYERSPGTPIECSFTRRDGSTIIVQAHAMANYEEGILDFVAIDITDQKLAEEALKKSETRLAKALQQAKLAYWNYRFAESEIKDWSEEAADILGIPPKDLPRRFEAYLELVHPEDRVRVAGIYEVADPADLKREGYQIEYRVARPNGGTAWIQESCEVEYGEDEAPVGYLGTIQDITEQKQTEDQLRQAQKMEAVGQLTGGVAHDFNNLLAVVTGNAELLSLQLGEEDPKVQAVLRAASRGGALTQHLLAFSRKQALQPRVLDLNVLVQGMREMLSRSLGETIEIETAAAPNLWTASADPGQVESALLNLALNARDAMPGGGKLIIECANALLDETYMAEHPEAKAGDYVVLAVSDGGSGMTAEVQTHAFEPFFTTKEVGQGSGLGLSMVYGFAKQSGGHVVIYSEAGQGTTVKLYLPRAEAAARIDGVSRGEEVPRGRGEVILVIEDDPDVGALAARMLEDLSYRVIHVPAVAQARKVLADERRVDLVLSDVVLPGGTSGPEFAEQTRATDPDLKIIFMSGYPAEAAKRNGFLGSDQVLLSKPFSRHQLAKALRDALD